MQGVLSVLTAFDLAQKVTGTNQASRGQHMALSLAQPLTSIGQPLTCIDKLWASPAPKPLALLTDTFFC